MPRRVEVISEVREQRGGQPIRAQEEEEEEKEEARWMDEGVARTKMSMMMRLLSREYGEMAFFRFLIDIGLLEASLGAIWLLGAVLERSWSVLEHLRSHLAAS